MAIVVSSIFFFAFIYAFIPELSTVFTHLSETVNFPEIENNLCVHP